jgi:hypothetical protein
MLCHMLREQKRFSLIAVALLLIGCGGMPKNAEEYRQATRSSPFTKVESFEVARPFQEVSSTLQKKAGECLARAVRWTATSAQYLNTRSGVDTYKPTFIANAKRAELHVQLKRSAVIEVGAPPDGSYRIVLDATPLADKRTRIDMYTQDSLLRKALRGWVQGDNLGCPDLTKR